MTLEEFKLLDMNARAEWLWAFQPLDERTNEEHTILLYSLPDFYAEVWYHRGNNHITTIKAFRTIQNLIPYLSHRN